MTATDFFYERAELGSPLGLRRDWFDPFSFDLVGRVYAARPARILQIGAMGAGTARPVRFLVQLLPKADIVVTDSSRKRNAHAWKEAGLPWRVRTREDDPQALRFGKAAFDTILCHFGVMFLADRIAVYREARRVLAPGGAFLFTSLDRIDANTTAAAVAKAVAEHFPEDPPTFLERVPFGYHDPAQIEAELRDAGFESVLIETIKKKDEVLGHVVVDALCMGTPLNAEIEARIRPGSEDQPSEDWPTILEAAVAAMDSLRSGDREKQVSAHLVTAR